MQKIPDLIDRVAATLPADTRTVLLFLYRRQSHKGRAAHQPATPAEIAHRTGLPRGEVVPALGELFGMGLIRLSPGRGYVATPQMQVACLRLLLAAESQEVAG